MGIVICYTEALTNRPTIERDNQLAKFGDADHKLASSLRGKDQLLLHLSAVALDKKSDWLLKLLSGNTRIRKINAEATTALIFHVSPNLLIKGKAALTKNDV